MVKAWDYNIYGIIIKFVQLFYYLYVFSSDIEIILLDLNNPYS